jgi:Protein of unknown function (DUF1549)/Protein of unknown function (DUF1553)
MRRFVILAVLCASFASSARAEQPLREFIDAELAAAWKARKITPAAPADDATFLRRVHLDLVGTIPTAEEAKKFLDDSDKEKRTKLVERLLADPRFAAQMTDVWDLMLFGRNPPNGDATRRRDGFRAWLSGKFARNERYDRLVKDLLLGEEEGSELFLVQFRSRPEDATEAVSRLFLGTQLQCARCHDHPFEDWKQRDFYGMAGFLVRVVVLDKGSGKTRYSLGEKSSGEVLFSGAAKDQRPGRKGEPVKPKFLGGDELKEPPLPKGFKEPDYRNAKSLPKPPFSRKSKLAEWVTAKDNPYFARAAVNRVWAQYLGRGLVHPVDDLSSRNDPALPAVMKKLSESFVAKEYDLKWLIREVVHTKAYQLSDKATATEALPKWWERARVRPLSAEELLATMRTANAFDRSGGKFSGATVEYFRRYFGEPTNGQGEFQGGLQEHLFLDNSGDVRTLIRRRKGNLADEIASSKEDWEKRVDRLFLAVLTRPPSDRERAKFVEHLKSDDKKTDALIEEAIWALMNTAEFRFNR